ncbi:putative transposase Ptta/En/Spm plant [Arabidopsis thaliana x Arabidopsis arenosa]|uniref:Putative transposase Ptta/En/Spm plant n=1 Tax=Arabidopsis thaliana x Arabidopsis arenosa TaxID=1240361 RepID=A0A8T2A881_9BRAS|nr:putative transposase Ptta/En/Spm plant [Arabidopsis thaliana x Arabidopsis arenosa]
MEEELERPVSLGEVFIKTHTKPDGMTQEELFMVLQASRGFFSMASASNQLTDNERRDAENAAREAEHSRAVANQKHKDEHLFLVEKYMRATYLAFLDFMETHSTSATTKHVSTGFSATFPTTTSAAS